MHWMAQNLFLNIKEIKINFNPIFMLFFWVNKKTGLIQIELLIKYYFVMHVVMLRN